MTRVLESWYHATKNVYVGASTTQRSSWQVWLNVANKMFMIFHCGFNVATNRTLKKNSYVLQYLAYILEENKATFPHNLSLFQQSVRQKHSIRIIQGVVKLNLKISGTDASCREKKKVHYNMGLEMLNYRVIRLPINGIAGLQLKTMVAIVTLSWELDWQRWANCLATTLS